MTLGGDIGNLRVVLDSGCLIMAGGAAQEVETRALARVFCNILPFEATFIGWLCLAGESLSHSRIFGGSTGAGHHV